MLFPPPYELLGGPLAAAGLVYCCFTLAMQHANTKKDSKNSSSCFDNLHHYNNYYLTRQSDVNIICCQPVCH